jgi:uncharacterized membrane protein SpoIIM required for sporulation
MRVSDALDAAVSTLAGRPSAILPIYLVGQSAGTIARALPLLGLFVAYLLLLSGGRLAALEEAVREAQAAETELPQDPEAVGPETAPIPELEAAVSNLITPGTVAAVGLSALVGLVVFVVVGAVIHAGQIHTVYAALQARSPVVAGVSGAIRDAWAFVGLRLLEYGLYLLVTAIYGLVVFVAAAIYAADQGIGLLVAAGAALLAPVWLFALVAIAAVFVFAPQSVVVDGRGTIGGLRGGAGFIRRRPGAFAVYVVIAIGVSGAVTAVGGALAVVGGRQLVGVLTLLAVTPFLHLLKTAIYADGERIDPDPLLSDARPPVLDRVRGGWWTSLSTLWGFTKRTPGLSALSLALFGVGVVGGYYATVGFAVDMGPEGDPAAIFGPFPVGAFVTIAANNWLVAVGQSFAGLALGVPTAVNLLFNGAIVGIVSGLSADLLTVAALVVPHALIEVPALVVSGALGFHLALVGWRRIQGRIDDATVANELRTAFWVLVGLAVVFVIAAFVEAFLTPWIASMIL